MYLFEDPFHGSVEVILNPARQDVSFSLLLFHQPAVDQCFHVSVFITGLKHTPFDLIINQ